MKETVHRIAAGMHLKFAREVDELLKRQSEPDIKTAHISVAGQNFFYAAINFIEARLAKVGVHSNDHDSRLELMLKNHGLFSDSIISKYKLCVGSETRYRGKVTYRGENGNKYLKLKELAEELGTEK